MASGTCRECGSVFVRNGPSLIGPFCSHRCMGLNKRVDPVEYFWKHVDKTDGCWLWTGERNKGTRYGQIPRSFRRRQAFGIEIKAHRVSWLLMHGAIPDGLRVLHRCDNPPCVNPDHLFLGTLKDNAIDRDQKGRANTPRGEASSGAKLCDEQVKEIRRAYAEDGATLLELANCFHVAFQTISRIVNRTIWRHVA